MNALYAGVVLEDMPIGHDQIHRIGGELIDRRRRLLGPEMLARSAVKVGDAGAKRVEAQLDAVLARERKVVDLLRPARQ